MTLTEDQRRLLGNLSEPRSIPNLTRVLRADQHSSFDANDAFGTVVRQVDALVREQVREGRIVALGGHSEAKSVLRAVRDDKDAIDIPKAKSSRLADRLESGRDGRLDTGDLFVLSKQGHADLQA